jgi:hypothetical protein
MDGMEHSRSLLDGTGIDDAGSPPPNVDDVDGDLKFGIRNDDGLARGVPWVVLLGLEESLLNANHVDDGSKPGGADDLLLEPGRGSSSTAGVDDGRKVKLGAAVGGVKKGGVPDFLLLELDKTPSRTAGVDEGLKVGVADDGVENLGILCALLFELDDSSSRTTDLDNGIKLKLEVSDTGIKKRGISDALVLKLRNPSSRAASEDDDLKLGVTDDRVRERRGSDALLLKLDDMSSRTAGVDDGLKLAVAGNRVEESGDPDVVLLATGVDKGVKKRGVSDDVLLALGALPLSTDCVDDSLKLEVVFDGVKRGVPDTLPLAPGEPAPNKNGVDDGVVKRSVLEAVLLGTGEVRLDLDWLPAKYSGGITRSFPRADVVIDGVKSAVLKLELIDPAGIWWGTGGSVPCS